MARGNFFGYETYLICEDGFRNVEESGKRIGFALNLRLANYRGYLLSQIEDICISVDGVPVPRAAIRFRVGGKTYTLREMENITDHRWELTQVATVTCLWPGGLTCGEHQLDVEEHVRVSYIPMVAVAYASKRLTLAA